MSWLSEALHGVGRALTVPAHEREQLQTALQQNPALLEQVNNLKSALTTALIHDSGVAGADPLAAALAGMALSQQIERMIPTPPMPEPALKSPSLPLQVPALPPTESGPGA